MQTLTQANFMTSVRYFLTLGISYSAGKGWISADTATNIGILALALLPFIWGLYSNAAAVKASDIREVTAVRAAVAMANDPMAPTPPPAASIGPLEAKSIVATYASPT